MSRVIADALSKAGSNFPDMPQVGGDPIVESGSNADGEWTRWSDGTQVIRKLFSLDAGRGPTIYEEAFVYPIAFINSPVPILTIGTDAGTMDNLVSMRVFARNQSIGTTGLSYVVDQTSSSYLTANTYFVVVGRWK